MRKEIFESESEAFEVVGLFTRSCNWDEDLLVLKKHNLIKKSIVEEAEEMYRQYMRDDIWLELVDKQHEAIQYLKERQI